MSFLLQGLGLASAEKGRKEQKKVNRIRERQARLQSARDAMAQVRQARIAQAQIIQGAATQGTEGSSAAQGGYSAVGALTSGNMQFINQMDSFRSNIYNSMETINRYGRQAGLYNQAANLSFQIAGMGMDGGFNGKSPSGGSQMSPAPNTQYVAPPAPMYP